MAQFQMILGVVLIITSIIVVILSIYQLVIIGKARTNLEDSKSTLTDGEKKGAIGVGIIIILAGIIMGVYGIVLVLPEEKTARGISALRGTRSISGEVLSPSDV